MDNIETRLETLAAQIKVHDSQIEAAREKIELWDKKLKKDNEGILELMNGFIKETQSNFESHSFKIEQVLKT